MIASQESPTEQNQAVLIADDNKILLDLLSHGFKLHGCRVYRAENGCDAWALFNREHIDFVLTDIRMPGLNGKELSHRIRNKSPFVKIAVMTGGDADVVTELLKDGTVNYYFPKPFDLIRVCDSLMAEAQTA